MEGGTPVEIDLESGLDVKSSDMLVNVHSPTFQHNWQKYQGRYLPNSLRFEKNGYAAGWNVYNFEFNIKKYYHETGHFWLSYDYESSYAKMLNLYAHEEDVKPTAFYAVVPLSMSLNSSFTVSGNTITTKVVDTSVQLVWDPATKTFTSVTSGYSTKVELLADYSSLLTVYKNDTVFDFNMDVYPITGITGDSFETSFSYTGYDGSVHTWGGFTANVSGAITAVPEGSSAVITQGTSDHYNGTKFDYYIEQKADFKLTYTAELYYLTFTYKDLVEASTGDHVILGDADNDTAITPFNITYSKHTNPGPNPKATMYKGSSSIDANYKVAVWFSVNFNTANLIDTSRTKYFNNCFEGAIWAKCDPNGLYVAPYLYSNSVFDKSTFNRTSLFTADVIKEDGTGGTGPYMYIGSKESAVVPGSSQMEHRCNRMWIGNYLTIHDTQPYKYEPYNDDVLVWPSNAWSVLASSTSHGRPAVSPTYRICQAFGTKYYRYSDRFVSFGTIIRPADIFDLNEVFTYENRANKDSFYYTRKNLQRIRSIKRKVETASPNYAWDGDENDYIIQALGGTDQDIWYNYMCRPDTSVEGFRAYSESQDYQDTGALYNNEGYYIGTSFEEHNVEFSDAANFWPFRYVPRYNLRIPTGKIEPAYTYYKGVYAADASRGSTLEEMLITDFNDFRVFCLGQYNSAATRQRYAVSKAGYTRARKVHINKESFLDWMPVKKADYASDEVYARDMLAFNNKWKLYFGGSIPLPHEYFKIDDPLHPEESFNNTDTKYMDFEDVSFVYEDFAKNAETSRFLPMGQAGYRLSNNTQDYTCSAPFRWKVEDTDGDVLYIDDVFDEPVDSIFKSSDSVARSGNAVKLYHQNEECFSKYAGEFTYYAEASKCDVDLYSYLNNYVTVLVGNAGRDDTGYIAPLATPVAHKAQIPSFSGSGRGYGSTVLISEDKAPLGNPAVWSVLRQPKYVWAIGQTYNTTSGWVNDTSKVTDDMWIKATRIAFKGDTLLYETAEKGKFSTIGATIVNTGAGSVDNKLYLESFRGCSLVSIPMWAYLYMAFDYYYKTCTATELADGVFQDTNDKTYRVVSVTFLKASTFSDPNFLKNNIFIDRVADSDCPKAVHMIRMNPTYKQEVTGAVNEQGESLDNRYAYCAGLTVDENGKRTLRIVLPFIGGKFDPDRTAQTTEQTLYYARLDTDEEGNSKYNSSTKFMPGIVFGTGDANYELSAYDIEANPNLSVLANTSNVGALTLDMTIEYNSGVYFTIAPSVTYDIKDSDFSTEHKYYRHDWYNSNTVDTFLPSFVAGTIDPVEGTQALTLSLPITTGGSKACEFLIGKDAILNYHSASSVSATAGNSDYCTVASSFSTGMQGISLIDEDEEIKQELSLTESTIKFIYKNNEGRFFKPRVLAGPNVLSSFDVQTGEAVFSSSAYAVAVTYNYYTKSLTNKCIEFDIVDIAADNSTEAVAYTRLRASLGELVKDNIVLKAVHEGKISSDGIVTFSYLSTDYTVALNVFDNLPKQIDITTTDVRTPDTTTVLASIDPEKELQIVKQQWNTTTEVENFWWLSKDMVVVLTRDKLILRRKTSDIDDWDGDRFEDVYTCARNSVIPTTAREYFVTNMYNCASDSKGYLVTITPNGQNVDIAFYSPYNLFEHVRTVSVAIRIVDLGIELNSTDNRTKLNTYTKGLTSEELLSHATWSNTCINDKYLFIGCHYDSNFNQWTMRFNKDSSGKWKLDLVIQGYGFVGLKGDLTGGQIPYSYFSVGAGFSDTVYPLSDLTPVRPTTGNADAKYQVLREADFNSITSRVYGTDTQQWYVSHDLTNIVSHIESTVDSNGSLTMRARTIPLSNNYTAVYKSPSFGSSVLGDNTIDGTRLKDLFSSDITGATDAGKEFANIWSKIAGLVGNPRAYVYSPRFSTLMYLQQTLGQYAYVHYNSTTMAPKAEAENRAEDTTPIVKMSNEMQAKTTAAVLSSDYTFGKQTNRQDVSVTTLSDISRKFFFFNILSGLAEGISAFDLNSTVNAAQAQSAVSDFGRKFETMFVENVSNMVSGSIVTQSKTRPSVTSIITGVKSLDMFYSTSANQRVFAGPGFVEHQFVADCVAQSVTDVQVEGKTIQFLWILPSITSYLKRQAFATTEQIVDGLLDQASAWAGDKWTGAIASALILVAVAIRATITAARVALTALDEILANLAGKGATANVDSTVTEHRLTVEGKHRYGERSETFMWPCDLGSAANLSIETEEVVADIKCTPWELNLLPTVNHQDRNMYGKGNICNLADKPSLSSNKAEQVLMRNVYGYGYGIKDASDESTAKGDTIKAFTLSGSIPYYQATCYGKSETRELPEHMACIIGAETLLPKQPFKNENIGVSEPVFTPSLIHDYIIDTSWEISQTCTYGLCQWVSVKDTKVTNCPPSNMIINSDICLLATPYEALEVLKSVSKAYNRPFTITPNALAFNSTGYNTIFDNKLYHSFDGMSQRIVSMIGAPGLSKNVQAFLYAIQVNDRFKRSNIIPANEVQGNFNSPPIMAMDSIDPIWTCLTVASEGRGLDAGTVGEDKDAVRWSIPMFTEAVSTLPAVVKTMTASPLAVVDGVTSLVTSKVTDTNARYKAPVSVDFAIGKNLYRATNEYICSITNMDAGSIVTELIPIDGLTYIGATPSEAFFYSQATRCYYIFTGSALTKMDMLERFRNIQRGYWDFVNQEVVMPSLMTFTRLDSDIKDTDTETDNIIMPVLSKSSVSGELPPPLTTIFNDRSWYKVYSLPSGLVYQGPNRVIINRSVFTEYMLDSIKGNLGKWARLNKEKFDMHREYLDNYEDIYKTVNGIDGWTYNPFVLVTSPLGVSENTDCMFEWEITFCWPVEMDLLYGADNYACVNIMADTMTPGGKVQSRPTHIYLTKELFTNNGNYGYYSFRFQSKNGVGNRERLRIWSDQYIAISSLTCETKVMTSRRTQVLTQQIDVQNMKEL